jgi:hypothetical protein
MSVNNIFFNPSLPQVLETQFLLAPSVKTRMIDTVLSQKDTANYHGGYTFHVQDSFGDFKILYNFFFNTVINLFGNVKLSPTHKTWCWANVYNKESFRTNAHNHIKTSSINSVYYLKMPKDVGDDEGGLNLYPPGLEPIQFQPDEGDLLIMPNNTVHEPLLHNSMDYRISVNMEMCIESNVFDYFTQGKIYANAKPKL